MCGAKINATRVRSRAYVDSTKATEYVVTRTVNVDPSRCCVRRENSDVTDISECGVIAAACIQTRSRNSAQTTYQ